MEPGPASEEHVEIREASERLRTRFGGEIEPATIERIVDESVEAARRRSASVSMAALAERVAADRLRALLRLGAGRRDAIPGVLFLCVHNAGRSQMAAGWMRHLGADGVAVFSGGSEPGRAVNEAAVAAMAERGIDIAAEVPEPWSDEILEAVDVVVTMGCGDACPILPGTRYVDWAVEDPAGRPLDAVRPIRDDIERRVRELLEELDIPAAT